MARPGCRVHGKQCREKEFMVRGKGSRSNLIRNLMLFPLKSISYGHFSIKVTWQRRGVSVELVIALNELIVKILRTFLENLRLKSANN